jgi:hypothetical protein
MSDGTITMIGMLILSILVSPFLAVFVRVLTKIFAKFYPQFGMAYKAALTAVVVTVLLGCLVDLANSSTSGVAWVFTVAITVVVGFVVKLFVYSRVIVSPTSGAIGAKKSLQIAFVQMLCEVVVICALGWFVMPSYIEYVEHLRQNSASKPNAKPISSEQKQL